MQSWREEGTIAETGQKWVGQMLMLMLMCNSFVDSHQRRLNKRSLFIEQSPKLYSFLTDEFLQVFSALDLIGSSDGVDIGIQIGATGEIKRAKVTQHSNKLPLV